MKTQALARNVRMSPLKLREIGRNLVGMQAQKALQFLRWSPRKSARLFYKTLKSAIGNAENNLSVSVERLVLQEVVVDEGAVMKRFQPVSRGSAHPIRKRMSHIKIVLTDEEGIKATQGKRK